MSHQLIFSQFQIVPESQTVERLETKQQDDVYDKFTILERNPVSAVNYNLRCRSQKKTFLKRNKSETGKKFVSGIVTASSTFYFDFPEGIIP